MGFFSWKTADTGESIANRHSSRPVKPVYLLQPNGQPPIKESSYDGYGRFGNVDAYNWLAKVNFGTENMLHVAINADCGGYHEDDDHVYLCSMHLTEKDFRAAVQTDKKVVSFETYGSVLPNGKTPNECIQNGLWRVARIKLTYPLKFSFNPDAVYEDLPASQSCEYQGYFYPEEEGA